MHELVNCDWVKQGFLTQGTMKIACQIKPWVVQHSVWFNQLQWRYHFCNYHLLECDLHQVFDALVWVLLCGLSDQAVLQHVEHLFLGNVPKSYTSKLWKPNGGQSQYMDSNVVDNSQKAYMIHFIAFLNFIFYPMPHGERMIVPQSTLSHWRSCRCPCQMRKRLEYN